MKCLTWQQPYASAVAAGVKKIENRPRCILRVPAGGVWLGLHAGLGWYGAMHPRNHHWLAEEHHAYHAAWAKFRSLWPECPDGESLPFGVVLGAVHFAWDEPYPTGEESGLWGAPRRKQLLDDPWAFGKHCYAIDEVLLLETPIAARGMQGLWPASPDVATALEALIAARVAA